MNSAGNVLTTTDNAELLSYIINRDPVLSANIDLPVQGEDIAPIGKLIVSNERYRNAFLNIVNEIGLTIINDKRWRSPWDEFTEKGELALGQTIRELYVDIANVYDYNEYKNDVDHFLENVVPNVYEYMHELNYEKFYKTTTSDEELAMAFSQRGGLLRLIDKIIASLYEGYEYDKYIVEKYLLCRRILDGTIAVQKLNGQTARDQVAEMKATSDLMTFRKPNYNPAGVRSFSAFANQFFILTTTFDGQMSVNVLATSYFRNDAMLKSNMAVIDGFDDHDKGRLIELLGNGYEDFTETELEELATIPAVIIDRDFFQVYNYYYDTRATEFFNPESLRTNHWLHTKKVLSSSPFAPAVVFTTLTPSITSVSVSPSTATINQGQSLKMSAQVVNVGFANKSVIWTALDSDGDPIEGVSIDATGLLKVGRDVAGDTTIVVKATSVYDNTKYGTASVSTPETSTEVPTEVPTEP